ncbi:MAG: ATP-binding cassette domain-containing protein [Chloroflexi bacterium]|nr:ATP-binding cassette domain-containing protein [Chloroflexota bacterium]
MTNSIILQTEGISKRFEIHHIERHVPAFDDISFTLGTGEFVLVAGPNGAGKSTLLRCLYRTYLPTSGHAWYHSRHGRIDLARAAEVDIVRLRAEEIGHVTQFLRPRPRVSALELVMEPLVSAGENRSSAREQAEHLLALFGLKNALWNAYPTTFSGGEQQKVNLARSLARGNRLLLLDEPTASLDASARAALVQKLSELKASGVAMLGVFHHPEDVQHLVDRTLMIRPVIEQEDIENVAE